MTDIDTRSQPADEVAPVAAGPPRTGRAWRCRLRLAAFPVVVLLVFLGLVALNLNGSSLGLLGNPTADSSLLAGAPRPIRTDEYLIQTANSIGNVRRGFLVEPWMGLVQARQPASTLGGPSASWSEVLRPQDWGYFVAVARGLAWHWWFSFLVALLGLYGLIQVLLRRSVLVSASLAVVGSFTPYTAWWSSPAPGLVLGYAAGAAMCAILAIRAGRAWATALLAAASGLLVVASVLVLYPPWLVSTGLVVAAVVVGQAIDLRVPLRRLLLAGPVLALSAGVPFVVWYLQNRAAIKAISDTYYPGNRRSTAGEADLSRLLGAGLNPWYSGEAGVTLRPPAGAVGYATYANQSESAGSWLPAGLLVAIVLLVAWALLGRLRDRHQALVSSAPAAGPVDGEHAEARPPFVTFWLVGAVTALLLAWSLLPVPDLVGKVTLLNRVPPWRTPLALGLGCVLLVALAGSLLRRRRLGWPTITLLTLGVLASVAGTVWSEHRTVWDHDLVSRPLVALSGLAIAAGFAVLACGRWQRTAAVLLAAYCAWSWGLVNPLVHGLGPLADDPVTKAMIKVEQREPGAVAAVYGETRLIALVAASGVQSLSGTTFYPDPEVMTRLTPAQKALWNNYLNLRWTADRSRHPAWITQVRGTSMVLAIDPCAPDTLALPMTWTLSQKPIAAPCLRPVDVIVSPGVGKVYRYRVLRTS